MTQYLKSLYLCICLLGGFISCQTNESITQDEEIQTIMEGISNQAGQEKNPYLTAGDKTYIIGTQDGNFPDLGGHTPGEMGGVWNHLIKLLDGFWVKMTDNKGNSCWLENAIQYTNYPFGSKFEYAPLFNNSIRVNRFQFCPQGKNGVVITYTIENVSDSEQTVLFDFVAKTDLLPVWSSGTIGLKDANDVVNWDAQDAIFKAKDLGNNWNVIWGADQHTSIYQLDTPTYINTQGTGKSASSTYTITLPKNQEKKLSFVIAGSKDSEEDALKSYKDILANHSEMLEDKKMYYTQLLERGRINIPDKKLQEVYNWCKINTEWLAADMESAGRFLGAGAIEYPWLFGCDNSYSLQGLVATGDQKLAKETLRVIKEMSEKANRNGRILHEMAFNAFVSHKGNTQETAHFVIAVWNVYKWTGDNKFLADMYPYMQKGLNFLLKDMDTNKNMFPEGYGIMEVRGLNAELIDVSVYTQQALEVMSQIALIMGEEAFASECASQAIDLKERINDLFWDKDLEIYCDFYGTREQALETTKGAIEQVRNTEYRWDVAEVSLQEYEDSKKKHIAMYEDMYKQFEAYPTGIMKGWLTNKNWVISTPIETHIASEDRAIRQLDKVRKEHCGEYGPYLSAVERDRMMTIATGVQAMAECAYGRVDEALWYINRIVDTFGRTLPGSINEMMPDYGCPVQAWTIYGIATPLIRYIYGIQPEAYKQTLTLSPNLPSDWDFIEMKDLPVGNNKINYKVKQLEDGLEITLDTTEKDWSYLLRPVKQPIKRFIVNGKEQRI